MPRRARLAILVLAALSACSPSKPDDASVSLQPSSMVRDWTTVRMELRRGVCLGTCPAYAIEIAGDGAVSYCGIAYVDVVGEKNRTVLEIEAHGLFDRFLKAKFFDLRDAYVGGPTDGPYYFVTVWYDGRGKRVSHYSGSEEGNALLGELEAAIDDLAGSKDWIGRGGEGPSSAFPDCAKRLEQPPPSAPS